MTLKRFVKISMDSGNSYLRPIENIRDAIDIEFDAPEYFEVGDKFILEIIDMTQEDYEKLPEFEGW